MVSPIIKIDPGRPAPGAIEEVVAILRSGGIMAYPTETFYGLGADAQNPKGVDRIFAAKGRDFTKPIPVIIGREGDLDALVADISPPARTLIKQFWPGPLTLLFRAAPSLNIRLTGGTGKIGVRLSSNPVAAGLAAALGGAITATSANLSGQEECVTANEVLERLGNQVDLVVDGGPAPGGKGSTIVDATIDPVRTLREGAIPSSLIQCTLISGTPGKT